MKIYLVGGAVRDALLGVAPGDNDHVVVGETTDSMLAAGFRPVGRDFPVFLHPQSGEEYALARTERKSAPGYRGFIVHADPGVTLEEDLLRRDFTINAIARDDDGRLIDPHGGVRDIEARVLRHVGPAFVEDPLRVLRAARFMARLAPLGFTIAPETLALMQRIAADDELAALVPERIWQELSKALAEPRPSAFLRTLREADALRVILPEIDALYGVPQRAEYHPEIDTGRHQEMVSDMAARLAPRDARIGFAALTHDLGKALTPEDEWPRHIGHEHAGVKPLLALCERLRVPLEHRDLAVMVCREHLNIHRLAELRPSTVHDLLARCDGFRKPERIPRMALACEADKRGRLGNESADYPQRRLLLALHEAAMAVSARDVLQPGLSGPQIGEALRKARVRAIEQARAAFPDPTA
ncbi:multifunctional CCA addition/repair protein [Luteimonas sp. RIT-PG2_3]